MVYRLLIGGDNGVFCVESASEEGEGGRMKRGGRRAREAAETQLRSTTLLLV